MKEREYGVWFSYYCIQFMNIRIVNVNMNWFFCLKVEIRIKGDFFLK